MSELATNKPLSYGCSVPDCGWRMKVPTAFVGEYEIRTHLNDTHDIGDLHSLYVGALLAADDAFEAGRRAARDGITGQLNAILKQATDGYQTLALVTLAQLVETLGRSE